MLYMEAEKSVNPEFSSQGKKISFILHLYEIVDIHWTWGNHFMMSWSQIIRLNTLNLYSAVYKLAYYIRKQRMTDFLFMWYSLLI